MKSSRVSLIRLLFSTALALFFLLSGPKLDAAQEQGVIQGRLVNKTPGGAGVADQEVALTTYLNQAEKGKVTAKTDVNGNFEFKGLATSTGYVYSVVVTYQGAEYTKDNLSFAKDETVKALEIPVFDATTSDEAVSVERGHLIIDFAHNSLVMLEFVSFTNSGDKTYVGTKQVSPDGKKETLRFAIPKGAVDLTYNDGLMECCVFTTDNGFVDTMGVQPGKKDIIFSYRLPYSASSLTLVKPIDYPTKNFNLLVSSVGVQVSSDQIQSQGEAEVSGAKFLHLAGQDLSRGTRLNLGLQNLPRVTESAFANENLRRGIAFGLAFLAIAFAVIYPLSRRRLSEKVAEVREVSEDKKQALLLELAHLEDRYEAGQIPEGEYRRKREEKKSKLMEIMAPHRRMGG